MKKSEIESYDEYLQKAEDELKPLLTDEFLDVLVITVKTCGNSVDFVESYEFVRWCFNLAGKDVPEIIPIDYDIEE